jgi:shikimate dehydrogenase
VYRLGLIGFPLGHSLSPQIHNAALDALGLEGEYGLYPVPPLPAGAADLNLLMDRMRRGDIHGLNVTIPHKESVLPLLDETTPAGGDIGAINTIFLQDGVLKGDNTDVPGFLSDLYRHFEFQATSPRRALVLGAGGSARAVAFALLLDGWRVTIAARRVQQARVLCRALEAAGGEGMKNTSQLRAIRLEDVPDQEPSIDLMVNCTPLGMSPHVDGSPWPSGVFFPPGAVVYDLVYNPPETRLVQSVRLAGIPAVSGLGMLIEQAALALERWTGLDVPRTAMWGAIPPNLRTDESL